MRQPLAALCILAGLGSACRCGRDSGEPPLPGIERPSESLAARLRAAVTGKGAGYVPRTRHRLPGGGPRFTNRLILESSPYLLQHAHNPVDWYPWGDEAFARARRENKPVFLSVGYSTCHWCHVMEEESFEDEEIARYLNANYVCIKVDREERPDVDQTYLAAVQRLGHGGGWPLNVWLTPEREPFFGGTYFPARDGDRGGMKGLWTLLHEMQARFAASPLQVAEQAQALATEVRTELAGGQGQALPGAAQLRAAEAFDAARFDPVNGGLNGAPKFPSSLPVRLILRMWRRTQDARDLSMATVTLERMAAGGIYDQVGGGFHRYATDAAWRVPHFEKMLYDNALLASAYAEAYQSTHRPDFARVLRQTLRYVEREMTSSEGAFFSASDADSSQGEGAYFTWSLSELRSELGNDADGFAAFYGATQAGNLSGRNILFVPLPDEEGESAFEPARRKLLEARQRRPAPPRDDKIVAAWNGYMISAFAQAGRVLGDRHWTQMATRAADAATHLLIHDGTVRRFTASGHASGEGFLEDAAALEQGFLDLFQTTHETRWLEQAIALQAHLDAEYADSARGGYYRTAAGQQVALSRERPSQDGPEPSGNSLEALNLLRLSELTGQRGYRQGAEMLLRGFGPQLAASPEALSDMLLAVDFWTDRPKEIALVLPDADAPDGELQNELRNLFLPNDVAWIGAESEIDQAAKTLPWLESKRCLKGLPTAYVCTEGVCDLPTTSAEVFLRQLRTPTPLP